MEEHKQAVTVNAGVIEELHIHTGQSTTANVSQRDRPPFGHCSEWGSHVQIIKVDENGELQFDQEAFENFLAAQAIGRDEKIAVIAIAGKARKGKSFIMNFLTRYMKRKGYESDTDEWLGDWDEPLQDSFRWAFGRKAVTNGVLLWKESFKIQSTQHGEVVVLLMDTQGLFSTDCPEKLGNAIFSLAVCLSSSFIFNIVEDIDYNNMGYLQYLTESAKQMSGVDEEKPFQTLTFLVRDWKHTEEFEFGASGGLQHIKGEKETNTSFWGNLYEYFNRVQCYLMPYPGNGVANSKQYVGSVNGIADIFVKHLTPLSRLLLHPTNIKPNMIGKDSATVDSWVNLVKVLVEGMKNNEMQLETFMEAKRELSILTTRTKCADQYQADMRNELNKGFLPPDKMDTVHRNVIEKCVRFLSGRMLFGVKIDDMKKLVLTDMENLKHIFTTENELRLNLEKMKQKNHMQQLEKEFLSRLREIDVCSDEEFSSKGQILVEKIMTQYEPGGTFICGQSVRMENSLNEMLVQLKTTNRYKREFKNVAEKNIGLAIFNAEAEYESAMAEKLKRRDVWLYAQPKTLEMLQERAQRQAVHAFQRDVKNIKHENKARFRNQLSSQLDVVKKRFGRLNEENKVKLQEDMERVKLNIVLQYDISMAEVLLHVVVKEDELTALHRDIVSGLSESLSPDLFPLYIENDESAEENTMFRRYIDDIRKHLDGLLDAKRKWNSNSHDILTRFKRFVGRLFGDVKKRGSEAVTRSKASLKKAFFGKKRDEEKSKAEQIKTLKRRGLMSE